MFFEEQPGYEREQNERSFVQPRAQIHDKPQTSYQQQKLSQLRNLWNQQPIDEKRRVKWTVEDQKILTKLTGNRDSTASSTYFGKREAEIQVSIDDEEEWSTGEVIVTEESREAVLKALERRVKWTAEDQQMLNKLFASATVPASPKKPLATREVTADNTPFICCCWQGHNLEEQPEYAGVEWQEIVNTCPMDGMLTSVCYQVLVVKPDFCVPVRSTNANVRAVEHLLNGMVADIKQFAVGSQAYILQRNMVQFLLQQPNNMVW